MIEDFLHLPQGDVKDNPIQRLAQTKLYDINDVSTLSTLLLLNFQKFKCMKSN